MTWSPARRTWRAGCRPAAALAVLCVALGGAGSARCHPHATQGGLVIDAAELHLGDGRVLSPGRLLVENGIVTHVGQPPALVAPQGWRRFSARSVIPGLVAASVATASTGSDASVDPERVALDLVDPSEDPSAWLAAGVTALVISPGADRLVPGRGGVLRLAESLDERAAVRLGPLHAVLAEEAYDPPLRFEPNPGVNVDNPLRPAEPQRPHGPLGAVAELRRLITTARARPRDASAFGAVARREIPLRILAHREEDLRRALALAKELEVRLVLEGATEAWKLADDIAASGATVVLSVPHPGAASVLQLNRGDADPRTAAMLDALGVPIALADENWTSHPAPLLLAGAAVRAGLSPGTALAAVTHRAAAAAGAPQLGLLRVGAPADLVGLDAPPLALRARPEFVLVSGVLRWSQGAAAPAPGASDVLVLRAGTLHADGATEHDAVLVARDGKVASVGAGSAAPAGSTVLDFGRDAVLVPGFVDAFSAAGLEPGRPASGGARTRAAAAIEADEPSLDHALRAGVTTVLVAPPGSGAVEGVAALISTALRSTEELLPAPPESVLFAAPAPELEANQQPTLEVLIADAGVVFVLDEGVSDEGARSPRLKSLESLLGKAKGYHEKWTQWEKRDEKGGKDEQAKDGKKPATNGKSGSQRSQSARSRKPKEEPQSDPMLEALRPLFKGQGRAFLRAGRHDTILRGLDAFKDSGLAPVLVGGEEADLISDELAKRKVPVVLGPSLVRDTPGRTVNVAATLASAGVAMALGSFTPNAAAQLPLAAAAAVRAGLAPEEALAALTTRAAEVLGAPEGLGRLRRGDRADLVIFSGDPFEPTSRVLAVVARGRLVHSDPDALAAAARRGAEGLASRRAEGLASRGAEGITP